MRVSWMVVVGSPFVEMVGDIVPTGVGRSIFKINYNILYFVCVSKFTGDDLCILTRQCSGVLGGSSISRRNKFPYCVSLSA